MRIINRYMNNEQIRGIINRYVNNKKAASIYGLDGLNTQQLLPSVLRLRHALQRMSWSASHAASC